MTRLHNAGKEFERRLVLGDVMNPDQVTIGLFNDSTDTLVDSSTFADITTEPGLQPRATVTISNGTFSFNVDDGVLTLPSTPALDVSGDTEAVDSAFVLINYGGSDQLYATISLVADELFSEYDLSQIDNFVVDSPAFRQV